MLFVDPGQPSQPPDDNDDDMVFADPEIPMTRPEPPSRERSPRGGQEVVKTLIAAEPGLDRESRTMIEPLT